MTPTPTATPLDGIVLDVDGNGSAGALSDGLLVVRWAFGMSGPALVSSAIEGGCTRCTAPEVEAYLSTIVGQLDIDGDTQFLPLSDGLLVLRWLFGFRGDSLVGGVVSGGCTRCAPDQLEPYLAGLS